MKYVEVECLDCTAQYEAKLSDLQSYGGDRFTRFPDGRCPVCHAYSKNYRLQVIRVNEVL